MSYSIRVYRQRFMPEDVHDGDIDYRSTESYTEEYELDSDYIDNPIDWAVDVVQSLGYVEYSGYPFYPGGWYSGCELTAYGNYTGEREDFSFHLQGFTEDEQRAVYELV